MFAKVDVILSEKKNAVSIAKNSLYRDEKGQAYVFMPSEDGKTARRQEVTVGFENNDYLEVTEGLSVGQNVLGFAYGLKDGSKIETN